MNPRECRIGKLEWRNRSFPSPSAARSCSVLLRGRGGEAKQGYSPTHCTDGKWHLIVTDVTILHFQGILAPLLGSPQSDNLLRGGDGCPISLQHKTGPCRTTTPEMKSFCANLSAPLVQPCAGNTGSSLVQHLKEYSNDNLHRPENRCVTCTYCNKHFCGGNLDSNPNLIQQRKKTYFAQAK